MDGSSRRNAAMADSVRSVSAPNASGRVWNKVNKSGNVAPSDPQERVYRQQYVHRQASLSHGLQLHVPHWHHQHPHFHPEHLHPPLTLVRGCDVRKLTVSNSPFFGCSARPCTPEDSEDVRPNDVSSVARMTSLLSTPVPPTTRQSHSRSSCLRSLAYDGSAEGQRSQGFRHTHSPRSSTQRSKRFYPHTAKSKSSTNEIISTATSLCIFRLSGQGVYAQVAEMSITGRREASIISSAATTSTETTSKFKCRPLGDMNRHVTATMRNDWTPLPSTYFIMHPPLAAPLRQRSTVT